MLSTEKRANARMLAEELHSASVRFLRSLRRADQSSALSAPRLSALSVIMFAGPITLGELAGAEQVRPPTMTRIVQALEEQGLVVKRIDGTDRRAVRLSATTKGRRVLIQARRRRTQALAPRIGLLSAREQSSLKDAIDVMVRLTMK